MLIKESSESDLLAGSGLTLHTALTDRPLFYVENHSVRCGSVRIVRQ